MSVAPTGSGKTTLIIDNCLAYAGSMVVVDVKGDIARATARFRLGLGQDVHVLDPFGCSGRPTARLDPLAVFDLPNVEIESESEGIAATLMAEQRACTREVYWSIQGAALIAGVVSHVARRDRGERPTLGAVVDLLFHDDAVYRLAVELDGNVKPGSFEAGNLASFLALPEGSADTRGCVLSTARASVAALRSQAVRAALGPSTVSVRDLMENRPMTIYLVLPLERLHSHGTLLRLWLDTLLQALVRRSEQFDPPTLVVVDEAAQLGQLPILRTVSTFLRGSGVKLWTLWQDGSQLAALYPDWQSLVVNTSALTFMPGSCRPATRQIADLAGIAVETLEALRPFEQLVCESCREPRTVLVPQYWRDPRFTGRFDSLPRYRAGVATTR